MGARPQHIVGLFIRAVNNQENKLLLLHTHSGF